MSAGFFAELDAPPRPPELTVVVVKPAVKVAANVVIGGTVVVNPGGSVPPNLRTEVGEDNMRTKRQMSNTSLSVCSVAEPT